jgi:hypothetical protein
VILSKPRPAFLWGKSAFSHPGFLAPHVTAALEAVAAAGALNQNAAHGLRLGGEEVAADVSGCVLIKFKREGVYQGSVPRTSRPADGAQRRGRTHALGPGPGPLAPRVGSAGMNAPPKSGSVTNRFPSQSRIKGPVIRPLPACPAGEAVRWLNTSRPRGQSRSRGAGRRPSRSLAVGEPDPGASDLAGGGSRGVGARPPLRPGATVPQLRGTVALRPAKLGKGGRNVAITSPKPFAGTLWVANPTRQSLVSSRKPVLRGGLATVPTKRRQLGPRPCYRAPRLPYPRLALGFATSGAVIPLSTDQGSRIAAGVKEHGRGSPGFPGNWRDPDHSFSTACGVGTATPKVPGPRSAFGSRGRDEHRTHGKVRPSNPTKGARSDGRPGVGTPHSVRWAA